MGKIKILYLIDVFYAFGGAERNLFDIVRYIDKEKFTPYVFALKAGPEFAEFNKLGVFAETLEVKRIYSSKGVKSLFQLTKFVKRNKIDIIVSYHEGSDILAVLAGKLARVKSVISSRRDMGYQLKKRHILIYKIINKYFQRIITVSQAVAQAIGQREKVPASKMITIYNGVDLNRGITVNSLTTEELNKLGIDKTKKLVGTLATLRKIKGLKYFIRAAEIISERNSNVQFLIIGKATPDDDYSSKEMESNTKNKNIKFIEFQKDVFPLLKMLDIVVVPSLSEGFSNTILEAMAMAKPVVATQVGGNSEAVINNITGILVPPEDEQALAGAIDKILNDSNIAYEFGKAAKGRAQNYFRIEGMIKNIELLYLYIMSTKIHKASRHAKLTALVKLSFANMLYYSGILRACMWLKAREGSLLILAYHNIVNKSENYLSLDITQDTFNKQLRVIKNYFNIISLDEAMGLIEKRKLINNNLCITFDDGYNGIEKYLGALIKNENLPITIFVNTLPVEKNELLWFDKMIFAIDNSHELFLDLRNHNLGVFILSNQKDKREACSSIGEYLKGLENKAKDLIIEDIIIKTGIDKLPQAEKVYLAEEQLKELMKYNVMIEAHSCTHPIMAKLGKDDLNYEIEYGKSYLGKLLNKQVEYFAYPNGKNADINEEAVEVLKKSGYINAFTLEAENMIWPYRIGRFGIYEGSKFSEAVFALKLALKTNSVKELKYN